MSSDSSLSSEDDNITSLSPTKSKNEKDKKKKKKKREKAKWSAGEDADLVIVLREQQKLRNQANSGWKPIVWTAVVAVLEKNHKDVKPKTTKQVLTHFGNVHQNALYSLHITDIILCSLKVTML
ncbi:hypothetical protein M422DRAFT_45961 [Sphaerobolus stellatus SS14]|uniref:Myb-like domain-containing protein n=1 Tax=Sphaerobolus stellatus (strain SS14) TaxID=990650 RepID=A0A0C9W3S9_SPHS4|nr:hypothetical protein M422DRAFT_45961 [Sphaerobolus stellatus SS14]